MKFSPYIVRPVAILDPNVRKVFDLSKGKSSLDLHSENTTGIVVLGFLVLAAAAVMLAFLVENKSRITTGQLILFSALLLLGILGAIKLVAFLYKMNATERNLSELTKGQEIIFDESQVSFSTALLISPYQQHLLDSNLPYFEVPYTSIKEMRLWPGNSRGAKLLGIQIYGKEDFEIIKRSFGKQETEIINELVLRTSAPLINEDYTSKLSKKKTPS